MTLVSFHLNNQHHSNVAPKDNEHLRYMSVMAPRIQSDRKL